MSNEREWKERIERMAVKMCERDQSFQDGGGVPWERLSDTMKNAYRHNCEVLLTPIGPVPAIEVQTAEAAADLARKEAEARAALHAASIGEDEGIEVTAEMKEAQEKIIKEAEEKASHQVADNARVAEAMRIADEVDKVPELTEQELADIAAKAEAEAKAQEEATEKPLKAGQYFCTKCQKVHNKDSKLGVRHLKHDRDAGSN